MLVHFTSTSLVAAEPYVERVWHYIASRLVDHHSPLRLSDGLILFLLSLTFPPLLTWLAVVLWYKRRERNRFQIFRRVIAEGLERHLLDLAGPAARLILQTITRQKTEEPRQELLQQLSILEDFVAMRVSFFPPEELEQIGQVMQASEFVATIALSASIIAGGNRVAIVLHEPVLTAVVKDTNVHRLRDHPGVAADTLDQYLDVLEAAAKAWIKIARQFVSLHTRDLDDLETAEGVLLKVAHDNRSHPAHPAP
ncbi:MAG: hypothetical protein WA634_12070 [Silvibacterium sp.]